MGSQLYDEDERAKRENAWFLQNEKELIARAKKERDAREKERAEKEGAEERERLKALHFLKCPRCGHDMKVENLDGVEIDRCTHCEGVFFEAGELEQLLVARQKNEKPGFLKKLLGT